MEQQRIDVDEHLNNPKYDRFEELKKEFKDRVQRELPKWFPAEFHNSISNEE